MKKRLGGLSQIHVAKLKTDGSYETPMPLTGAKEITADLKYENVHFYSDNAIDYNDYVFNGGEGKLIVTGLSMSEYQLLFGSNVSNGGTLVKSNDVASEVAIMFERKKLGSQNKVMYVLYACKFAPPALSAKTHEGTVTEETVELTFSVRALDTAEVFYMVDSEIATGTVVDDWYQNVQKPKA